MFCVSLSYLFRCLVFGDVIDVLFAAYFVYNLIIDVGYSFMDVVYFFTYDGILLLAPLRGCVFLPLRLPICIYAVCIVCIRCLHAASRNYPLLKFQLQSTDLGLGPDLTSAASTLPSHLSSHFLNGNVRRNLPQCLLRDWRPSGLGKGSLLTREPSPSPITPPPTADSTPPPQTTSTPAASSAPPPTNAYTPSTIDPTTDNTATSVPPPKSTLHRSKSLPDISRSSSPTPHTDFMSDSLRRGSSLPLQPDPKIPPMPRHCQPILPHPTLSDS